MSADARRYLAAANEMLRGAGAVGAAHAWATLSQATHHRCYETAPTAAELRRLHAEVTALTDALDPAAGTAVGLQSATSTQDE